VAQRKRAPKKAAKRGAVKNESKTASTKFKPGNPGRPKGAKNKVTQEIRALSRSLVEDPEYLAGLKDRLATHSLPPALEQTLWYYAWGKPKDTLDVNDITKRTVSDADLRAAMREHLIKVEAAGSLDDAE